MHPFYSRAATMIGEIAAAVSFISKFLRTKGLTSERQLQTFSQSLQELLAGERAVVAGGRGTPGAGGDAAALVGAEPSGPRECPQRPGRPRSSPTAGWWLARRAAANGGSRGGFGAWVEGAPCPPAAGQRRGEEN